MPNKQMKELYGLCKEDFRPRAFTASDDAFPKTDPVAQLEALMRNPTANKAKIIALKAKHMAQVHHAYLTPSQMNKILEDLKR